MKLWLKLATVLALAALLLWAGSRFSTGMVRLMRFLDVTVGDTDTRFIDEEMDLAATLPPETLELTDQDYDAVQAVQETAEEEKTGSDDYLLDGEEQSPVDMTAEELADELD